MLSTRWIIIPAVLAFLAPAPSVQAQEKVEFDNLPKAVKMAVKEKFPEAKIKGATKEKNEEKETVYEIEMIIKGKTYDIIIDPMGEIETTEEEIDADDLPKAVKAAYAKAFPDGKIEKAEKVTEEDKKVTYEVMVKVGKKEPFEVVMAADGKIIKNGADDEKSEPKAKKEKSKD